MVSEGRFSFPGGLGRWTGGARAVVEVVLVVVLAVLLARVGWLIAAPADAVSTLTPRALPSPIQQTTRTDVRSDLSLLLAHNPFGTGSAPVEAVPDAPETSLNLRLVAIFMSTESNADSATIITPDNRTQRFQPGEQIIPGVELRRVLPDRVIIARNGSEESLMRGGRQAGLSVISEPGEDTAATTSTVTAPSAATFSPGVSARTLFASLNPVPEMTDGAVTSLVLQPRSNPQLMQAAGLEPGDRLVEINGRRIGGLDTARLAEEFGSASRIRVTVLRGGGARTLDINFGEGR